MSSETNSGRSFGRDFSPFDAFRRTGTRANIGGSRVNLTASGRRANPFMSGVKGNAFRNGVSTKSPTDLLGGPMGYGFKNLVPGTSMFQFAPGHPANPDHTTGAGFGNSAAGGGNQLTGGGGGALGSLDPRTEFAAGVLRDDLEALQSSREEQYDRIQELAGMFRDRGNEKFDALMGLGSELSDFLRDKADSIVSGARKDVAGIRQDLEESRSNQLQSAAIGLGVKYDSLEKQIEANPDLTPAQKAAEVRKLQFNKGLEKQTRHSQVDSNFHETLARLKVQGAGVIQQAQATASSLNSLATDTVTKLSLMAEDAKDQGLAAFAQLYSQPFHPVSFFSGIMELLRLDSSFKLGGGGGGSTVTSGAPQGNQGLVSDPFGFGDISNFFGDMQTIKSTTEGMFLQNPTQGQIDDFNRIRQGR